MDSQTLIVVVSVFTAGLTISLAYIGPVLAESRALCEALRAIAQQPNESSTLIRILFVAIYCFVGTMIVRFANPFWPQAAGG